MKDIEASATSSLAYQLAKKAGMLPPGVELGPVTTEVIQTPDGFTIRATATPQLRADLDRLKKAMDEDNIPPRLVRPVAMSELDVIAENRFLESQGADFRIPWPIPEGFVYRGFPLVMVQRMGKPR